MAESGHFDEAIKRFRNVASLDFQEWGEECQGWVARLQLYAEIADLADHKATLERAKRKWNEYQQDFGGDFDPLDVAGKISGSSVVAKPTAVITPPRSKVPDILADGLFAWVDIPAGPVTLVNTWDEDANVYLKKDKPQTFQVPAFAVAKYPVTNAQYAKFVEVGGYNDKKWWTADGWKQREKEKWTEPRYWQQDTWKRADHPVVGVAWYEAAAFCAWLTDLSGEKVMLPTEQQWQRAAQAKPDGSDSGWAYAWGEQWEVGRCNNSVSPESSKATTPVTEYAGKGDSLCGVVDLSGNVWEWCLTQYNSGSDSTNGTGVRVLRGGSWLSYFSDYFRADYRVRDVPNYRDSGWGFRISRSL